MGTRSRLRIRRRRHAELCLWSRYDGSLEVAGARICGAVQRFLAGHADVASACAWAEDGIRAAPVEGEGGDHFDYADLYRVLTGAIEAVHDPPCAGVAYEYTLDLPAGVLAAASLHGGTPATQAQAQAQVYLTLEAVREGATFDGADDEDAVARIVDGVTRATSTLAVRFDAGDPEADDVVVRRTLDPAAVAAAVRQTAEHEGTYCLHEWTPAEWLAYVRTTSTCHVGDDKATPSAGAGSDATAT